MLDPVEWPLFARHLRAMPWKAPGYALELAGLIARRVRQRRVVRGQSDPHKGLKVRPAWLAPRCEVGNGSLAEPFPVIDVAGRMPLVNRVGRLSPEDPETTFRQHRFVECTAALGHDDLARAAFKGVLEWLENPPLKSSAAWEPYSCCERVANLAILLAAHPQLPIEAHRKRLGNFFCESAGWIDAHLEFYGIDRTNNHFFNNGRALVIAGVVTGEAQWVETGLAIVSRFSRILFPEDGCLREGSSHYQLVVAGWFFDTLRFAGRVVSAERLAGLESLAELIGKACARFISALPNMDVHVGDISPDVDPLCSLARLQILYPERLAHMAPVGRLADWCFVHHGEESLVTRCASNWPSKYTTHAHADLGSFVWLHGGEVILADPGRRGYLPTADIQAQISASGHNGVTMDGAGALSGSVLQAGLWFPSPFAKASIWCQPREDGFFIEHDGFSRLGTFRLHRRELQCGMASLAVVDVVEGSGRVRLKQYWHFGPGFDLANGQTVAGMAGVAHVMTEGFRDAPDMSWEGYDYSQAYGHAVRCHVLVVSAELELPCRLLTRIRYEPCAA